MKRECVEGEPAELICISSAPAWSPGVSARRRGLGGEGSDVFYLCLWGLPGHLNYRPGFRPGFSTSSPSALLFFVLWFCFSFSFSSSCSESKKKKTTAVGIHPLSFPSVCPLGSTNLGISKALGETDT